MGSIYKVLFFWLVVLSPVCVCAGADQPLVRTLADSIRVGLAGSGEALNAARDLEIARSQVQRAYSTVLPHVSAEATYTRLDELTELDLGDGPELFGTLDNYSATARLDQLLFASGKVGAALRAARHAARLGEGGYADTVQRLVRDIETGFLDVLLSSHEVTVRRETLAQFEQLAERTSQRYDAGTASEFELLSARVRVANERPALISAENSQALAVAGFARLLAVPEHALQVTGEVARAALDSDLDTLLAYAVSNRPALVVAGERLALAEEDVRVTRAEGLPSLGAFATYTGANAYRFVSFENDWEWHWNVGLALRWNIWDGDLTRQETRIKRLERDKWMTAREELERSVLLEVRQAYVTVRNAEAAIEASRDNVALAQRALEIAKSRYDAGLVTYLEYTDATVGLSTARLGWLRAQHGHAVALAQLRYACGMEVVHD